jgi:hypothetical protein
VIDFSANRYYAFCLTVYNSLFQSVMAKVFSCEFQSAKQLYWIADELKTMGQGFRVQF